MDSQSSVLDAQSANSEISVRLLGGFRMSSHTGDFVLSARKDIALTGFLANTPGVAQRRSQLAALLWPDSEDSRARESLKQALLRLRRVLPEGLLVTDRHTARLLLERHQVDIPRLEDLLATGAFESILQAADMFRGIYLDGLEDIGAEFDDWRCARHQNILELIKQAALAAMNQAAAFANLKQAQELASHVARLDPLDEESARCLMAAYAAEGRVRQVSRVFAELEARLDEEVGVEPEQATQSLVESLIAEGSTAEASKVPAVPRIAVLVFEVGVDESTQRYFAEGLTDDITTDLAKTRALEVLPASAFTGLQGDLSRVLLARGATHVLQGSVRRADGRLRVNARLIDARDNQIIWAQRYDRTLEDVFDMQDAISSQVVLRLQRELSPDSAPGRDHGTRNAHAYEMFHKGRSLYLRGMNNHSLGAARALLERSIEIDSGFARAYAQLAICESCLAMSIANKTGENFTAQGLQHGREALEKAPNLALGYAAVGLANYAAGKYSAAEQSLRQAISLDENLFEAQFFLARNLRLQGNRKGAARSFRIAAALRPGDFRSSGLLGDELRAIGSVEEGRQAWVVAIERIEAELDRHPDNAGALAFGAPILVELQRPDQARDWCAWALAIEPDDSLLRYNLARMYAISNELHKSLEHLEIAYEAPWLVQRRLALWMRYDEDFKRLEGNRRFQRLLEYAVRSN